jgi:hypothetical protein
VNDSGANDERFACVNLKEDNLMATTQSTSAGPKEGMAAVNVWILPVLAGWIIPGGGHFLLKKTGRGGLILASIVLMFLFGMFMRGTMFVPERGDMLTTLITYGGFVADLASGALYFAASMFGYAQVDLPGAGHDYGTKFLVTAGLLNILAMTDVYEIAVGKKD